MELSPLQLRYLLAISRAGSFVKAAERLNISQPALSVAISRLEDVVGARLPERGRHGAQLTVAGSVLIRHAESLGAGCGCCATRPPSGKSPNPVD
jgi:LysR family pca operon transcriptional activator